MDVHQVIFIGYTNRFLCLFLDTNNIHHLSFPKQNIDDGTLWLSA